MQIFKREELMAAGARWVRTPLVRLPLTLGPTAGGSCWAARCFSVIAGKLAEQGELPRTARLQQPEASHSHSCAAQVNFKCAFE